MDNNKWVIFFSKEEEASFIFKFIYRIPKSKDSINNAPSSEEEIAHMDTNKKTNSSKYNEGLRLENARPKDNKNFDKVENEAEGKGKGEGSINQEGKSNNPSNQGNQNN